MFQTSLVIRYLLLFLWLGSAGTIAMGQTNSKSDLSAADYAPELTRQFFQRQAEQVSVEVVGSEALPVFRNEPLLNWQNPERNSQLGSFYVWMRDGRPLVVMSLFNFFNNNQMRYRHEFISMSDRPLRVACSGEPVWQPTPADLNGKLLEGIDAPDASPSRRLIQMRSLARELEGRVFAPNPTALKCLPQPLLRYTSEKSGVIDGGLFAMVIATDPEILVAIEARTEAGQGRWCIVPFPSHFAALELRYRDEVVWHTEAIPEMKLTRALQMPFAAKPYFVFTASKPAPTPEELQAVNEAIDPLQRP